MNLAEKVLKKKAGALNEKVSEDFFTDMEKSAEAIAKIKVKNGNANMVLGMFEGIATDLSVVDEKEAMKKVDKLGKDIKKMKIEESKVDESVSLGVEFAKTMRELEQMDIKLTDWDSDISELDPDDEDDKESYDYIKKYRKNAIKMIDQMVKTANSVKSALKKM